MAFGTIGLFRAGSVPVSDNARVNALRFAAATPIAAASSDTPVRSAPGYTPTSAVLPFFTGGKQAKPLKVSYTNHTHWDMEWYRLRADYQIRLGEVMDDVIARLDSGKLQVFSLDGQTNALQDYLDLLRHGTERGTPAERRESAEKIKKTLMYVKQGRLPVGPWFIQPDLFLTSGESLIRNLKKGIDFSNKLGVKDFVGYLPDPFGQPADVPILMNGFGIKGSMLWRGANPKNTEFWWEGRDGSRVLVSWFPRGYSFRELHIERMSPAERKKLLQDVVEKIQSMASTQNVLVPLGGDHMGATTNSGLDIMKQTYPGAKEVTNAEYLKQLAEDVGEGKDLEVHKGHLLDNTHGNILQGVYSSRLYLKQSNRQLEHQLTKNVEPMMAFSRVMLNQPPRMRNRELSKAWTELLWNQPHDSICGTSIDEVHLENEARFNTARAIANDIQRKEMAAINTQMAGPNQWIVTNNGDKPYTGVVKVKEWAYLDNSGLYDNYDPTTQQKRELPPTKLPQKTREELSMENQYLLDIYDNPRNNIMMLQREGLIWVENVPPHGVKVVNQGNLQPPIPVRTSAGGDMSNGLMSLRVNSDGTLIVKDEKTGKTYNGIHKIIDDPDNGDSYNAAPVPGAPTDTARLNHYKFVENGPLRSTLELTYILKNGMHVVSRVTLEAGNPQIQFETSYTNNTPSHKMQVVFPTDAPVSEVRAESQFGIEARKHDPDYNERQLMPADRKTMQELPTNSGALQRFVMANGQLVTTEGLTEYEVSGKNLNITLLRAFAKLSDMTSGVRDDEAGPPFATPGGQMIGREMKVRYAWQPTPANDSEAYDAADRLYGVTSAEQGRAEKDQPLNEKSMVRWDNPSVVASSIKWADSGKGLLVRVINTSDQPQTTKMIPGFDVEHIAKVDFAERHKGNLKAPEVTIKPFGVETLILVPKAP